MKPLLLVAAILFSIAGAAIAQDLHGSITGKVVDPRRFQPKENLMVTLSLDSLNLTNHTNFGAPVTDPTSSNFGMVTGQIGNKREIQYNFRFDF